jgi:phage shock protein PspC (stress-responsive transcriptional regulator)
MNEVARIHLGRQPFTIAAEAHSALRNYLDAIKKQVDDKEVVDEVEMRMAELLAERGIKGEKVVLAKDVDYLKQQLGNPRDFKEEADETAPSIEPETKRLFRDTDNAMIAGVAAGLSKYFGIDVLFIRILLVLSVFIWGWGILLYIVLWLLVPEAKTSSDRLQMMGKAVNVDSLKEVVERADVKGAARRANKSLAGPINSAFRFLLKLAGIVFVLSGLGALFGLIAAESYILVHNGSFLQDNIFPVGLREHLLLDIGIAVVAIVAVFIVLFGVAMFRRKWPIRTWITGMLIGLIFIGLAASGALAADVVPMVRDRYNANIHTTTRSVQPFTTVSILGKNADINYQVSDRYSVSLKYFDKPDISKIKTTVSNGTLSIDSQQFDQHRHCHTLCLPDTYDMQITVSSPNPPSMNFPDSPDKPVFPDAMPVYQQ